MADAAEMLLEINTKLSVVALALLISWATVRLQYRQIAHVLKWLVLALFAYPLTAVVVEGRLGTGGALHPGANHAAQQR